MKHLAFVVGKRPIVGEDGAAQIFRKHLVETITTMIDADPIGHVNPYTLLENEILDDNKLDSFLFLKDET